MNYCFGVDIGGTTVKIGLFQDNGTIIDKWEIPTHKQEGGKYILPDISKSLLDKINEKQINKKDILGAGVGVPAPIKEEGIVRGSANLNWEYKEVIKELHELTGFKIKTGNDANMAALGEMWLGSGKNYNNLIMITLGTGVGGGIIINGKPLIGSNGAGGEIGHLKVNYNEDKHCGCKGQGCLEQYASARGIVNLAKKKLEKTNKKSILNKGDITSKDVFDALKDGDEIAKEVIEEFGKYLGYAIANIAVIIDPEIILIGGGVSKAGNVIIEYVKKYFDKKAYFANRNIKFELASLGNDAGICGAAKLILI